MVRSREIEFYLEAFVFLNKVLIIIDIVQIEAPREEGVDIDVVVPDQILYTFAKPDFGR